MAIVGVGVEVGEVRALVRSSQASVMTFSLKSRLPATENPRFHQGLISSNALKH